MTRTRYRFTFSAFLDFYVIVARVPPKQRKSEDQKAFSPLCCLAGALIVLYILHLIARILGIQLKQVRSHTDLAKSICVDRTMYFQASYTPARGAHCSVGVTAPSTKWYLPEGSSNWGFECWLLIQNPNGTPAQCDVTYMIENEGPRTFPKTIPANSRRTFNMADDIGGKDASIMVDSDLRVIPERSMYKYWIPSHSPNSTAYRREGHCSIGTTSPANDYFLAEGTTAWGFTTYVLIQNPDPSPANIWVTYLTPSGAQQPQGVISMPANSRKTIRVNDYLPNTDFSTVVHGSRPIIAERAMYWPGTGGDGMHDSIGLDAPHSNFYLPDGESFPPLDADDRTETFTLVQNPNSSSVQVRISYLRPDGLNNVVFLDTIPADSRKTYNMADKFTGDNDVRAGVMVECLTTGKKIMCKRAMYEGENRFCGTDTIGGYSD
jgi:hypothetical protein